jgi:transcriptional regulator with XRE-family HTH domain
MTTPAMIIRSARAAAGLTQQQLAERMGTTQSAVARLERGVTDPRFSTVQTAVRAAGRRLEIETTTQGFPEVDDSLIVSNLRLSAADRVQRFKTAYRRAQRLASAGALARGRLA